MILYTVSLYDYTYTCFQGGVVGALLNMPLIDRLGLGKVGLLEMIIKTQAKSHEIFFIRCL